MVRNIKIKKNIKKLFKKNISKVDHDRQRYESCDVKLLFKKEEELLRLVYFLPRPILETIFCGSINTSV